MENVRSFRKKIFERVPSNDIRNSYIFVLSRKIYEILIHHFSTGLFLSATFGHNEQ